jgi:hypothetical protein
MTAFALEPRLVALKLREAGNGNEILLIEVGDPDELLPDQFELGFLGRLLCRKAADLLVRLGDALAQLRALAGPRSPSGLEQPLLAGERRGDRRVVAPVRQLGRKCDGGGLVALGEQPRFPRHQLVELGPHDTEGRSGHRIVEAQHDLAFLDLAALLGENLADDAAGRMLHLLDARFDDDGAGSDHGPRQMSGRRPAAHAANQNDGDGQPDEIELANGAAGVLLVTFIIQLRFSLRPPP